MYRKCLLTGALASALALSGCAQMESQWDAFNEWFQPTKALTSVINPYRPDTHQGNLITKEMIDQLHLGMTQMFGDPETRRLTVYFDDTGRLCRYEFTPMPDETQADQMILGDKEAFKADNSQLTVVDQTQKAMEDVEQNAQ